MAAPTEAQFQNARDLGLEVTGNHGPDDRTFGAWARDAKAELRQLLPKITKKVAETGLPAPVATWRGAAFATFDLGYLTDGSLSVAHVWPRGFRGGRPPVSPLHCHRFDLLSAHWLGDPFRDQLYAEVHRGSVDDFGGVRAESRFEVAGKKHVIGRVTKIRKLDAEHQEEMEGDDWVEMAEIGKARIVGPGKHHLMPAGMFHVASVPLDDLVVTINARRDVPNGYDQIVGNPNWELPPSPYDDFTPNHYEMVASQLIKEMGSLSSASLIGAER